MMAIGSRGDIQPFVALGKGMQAAGCKVGLQTAEAYQSFVQEHGLHDWLFPRVAAVVHHGSAGTTASGLRAGKPAVVVPFIADQQFWGKVVYD